MEFTRETKKTWERMYGKSFRAIACNTITKNFFGGEKLTISSAHDDFKRETFKISGKNVIIFVGENENAIISGNTLCFAMHNNYMFYRVDYFEEGESNRTESIF